MLLCSCALVLFCFFCSFALLLCCSCSFGLELSCARLLTLLLFLCCCRVAALSRAVRVVLRSCVLRSLALSCFLLCFLRLLELYVLSCALLAALFVLLLHVCALGFFTHLRMLALRNRLRTFCAISALSLHCMCLFCARCLSSALSLLSHLCAFSTVSVPFHL